MSHPQLQPTAYNEAIEEFSRALEIDGRYAGALSKRGDCLEEIGRYNEALKDFDAGIKLGTLSSYYDRGKALVALGREAEARAAFSQFLHLSHYLDYRDGQAVPEQAQIDKEVANARQLVANRIARLQPETCACLPRNCVQDDLIDVTLARRVAWSQLFSQVLVTNHNHIALKQDIHADLRMRHYGPSYHWSVPFSMK